MDFDSEVAKGITHLDVSPILFQRSISHLPLAVLVPDCLFWWLLRLKVLIMVVTKTLASMTTGLLIMLPFRHALLTACGNRFFKLFFKNQLPSLIPRHGLLRLILKSIFLTDIVLRAYKTLVLGKRIKICPRILVAASGRSCLMIMFNICTITYAVASYAHYMNSFNLCRHSCAKFVIWLPMLFIVLEFFTLLLALHIQYDILVSGLRRFKRNLLIFSRNCLTITHVVRRLITSTGCQPWSRKWLCFRKRTDCHFIFCHWLSIITMFSKRNDSFIALRFLALRLCRQMTKETERRARLNDVRRLVSQWDLLRH